MAILSGSNTYVGPTKVNGGILLVNGVHSTGTTGGVNSYYTVNASGTLGGTGRIAQSMTAVVAPRMIDVLAGGVIAPGASIGTLTLDGTFSAARSLNMQVGAEFKFDLDASGGTPDQLDFWNFVSGDLALDTVNGNKLNLSLAGTLTPGTYTVSLFRFYSDNGTTAAAHGLAGGLTLTGAAIDPNIDTNPLNTFITYSTNTIDLQYKVIPEPGSWAMLVGGLGLLAVCRRRRPIRR